MSEDTGDRLAHTDRLRAALLALRGMGAARTTDLTWLLDLPSKSRANKYLRHLVDLGLIKSHALGLGEEHAFTLTRKGWSTLARMGPPGAISPPVDIEPTEHRLSVARTWAALASALHKFEEVTADAWPEEVLRRVGGGPVVPDLMLTIRASANVEPVSIFLEADTGSERAKFLSEKIQKYASIDRPFGAARWLVAWVAPDEARATLLLRLLRAESPTVAARVGVVSTLTPDTVLTPIWREPQSNTLQPLIDQLSDRQTNQTTTTSIPATTSTTTPSTPTPHDLPVTPKDGPTTPTGEPASSPAISDAAIPAVGHPRSDSPEGLSDGAAPVRSTSTHAPEPSLPPPTSSLAPTTRPTLTGRPIARDDDRALDTTTWLTVPEAARHLHVSERLLRRLISEHELGAAVVRVGRAVRISRTTLTELLADHKEKFHALATEEESEESRKRETGNVLVDLHPAGGEGPDHRHRVLPDPGRQEDAHHLRGQGSGRRSAAANRRWLLGAKGCPETG